MLSLSKKMPQRAGRGKGKWCSKMTSNISEAAKSQPLGFGQYQSLAPARRQTANDQTTCVRTDRRGVEPETIGF